MQPFSGMVIAVVVDHAELLYRRCLVKITLSVALVAAVVVCLSSPAVAGDTGDYVSYSVVTPPEIMQPVDKDKDLASKYSDFVSFAKTKVQQLNRNHRFSRSRMEITRKPDGTYLARYHEIDDSTLSVKVRRSQSGSIPFVGVLSYKEQVFELMARTPEEFDSSAFSVVEIIPNRHIFSYRKGTWN